MASGYGRHTQRRVGITSGTRWEADIAFSGARCLP